MNSMSTDVEKCCLPFAPDKSIRRKSLCLGIDLRVQISPSPVRIWLYTVYL